MALKPGEMTMPDNELEDAADELEDAADSEDVDEALDDVAQALQDLAIAVQDHDANHVNRSELDSAIASIFGRLSALESAPVPAPASPETHVEPGQEIDVIPHRVHWTQRVPKWIAG